jgi:hypothetical protein
MNLHDKSYFSKRSILFLVIDFMISILLFKASKLNTSERSTLYLFQTSLSENNNP